MGPGPQVSPTPKSLLQLGKRRAPSRRPPGAQRAGSSPPRPRHVPPLVLMHFTLVLHLDIPPFNMSEVFRARLRVSQPPCCPSVKGDGT